MIVPKSYSIITSKDVLFFYIPRRYKTVNYTSLNAPYNFQSLPTTVSGLESVNEVTVNFECSMDLLNETFQLRSTILVERSLLCRGLITGSSAAIRIPSDVSVMSGEDDAFILYDPQGATEMFESDKFVYTSNPPITYIPGKSSFAGDDIESFYQRASTRGTVFVYVKKVPEQPCDA
jgi:hypothetical protein